MTESDQMFPGQIAALIVIDQHLIDRCLAEIPINHYARRPGVEDPSYGVVAPDRRDQSG